MIGAAEERHAGDSDTDAMAEPGYERSQKGTPMSKEGTSVELDAVMADPAAFFARPQDVVKDPRFSREIKLNILRQWERDAHNLAVADNEGMSGGEESMHGRVLHAIRSLEEGAGSDPMQPEGQSDRSPGRLENSSTGLVDGVRAAGCQILHGTREQPLAALMIAAWLGYLLGRVRHRL